ncbi:MAG: peptidase domain-containing ABC transporter [Acetobacteraceae bacterium]|nr:peptidase domain-containing ABC transporter [Acetobacteraceae bacterium]
MGPTILRNSAGQATHPRLLAVMEAARFFGAELDPAECQMPSDDTPPPAAALVAWARRAGMWARGVRLSWRHLMRLREAGPVVLLFKDGAAGLLTGVNAAQSVVFVKDPRGGAAEAAVPVDELRLGQVWAGETLLIRAQRAAEADPPFSIGWVAGLVLKEKRALKDIALGSLTLSFLTIFPPLLVMTVVDKVLTHHSYSTLALLTAILLIAMVFETLLGYARRLIVLVIGVRLDAKLNLQIFGRLLRLPLDYFERHPAGETMHRIGQVHKVRDFLTGKLLTTFLDLVTLLVLLPFLFYLNATLAWMVLGGSGLIALIILGSLRPLRRVYATVVAAETAKVAALGETIFGIRTVKSLALEPQRRSLWDERVAETGHARLVFGYASNWPQTLVNPIERFMSIGIVLIGAYLALSDNSGYAVGALFAFMMLSMRVAQPLVGFARLIEDWEQVGSAIAEAALVLNRPLETNAASGGLRPKFEGAISCENLSFTYNGTKVPALDRVTFSVSAGTMLGVVGRSGSGKSTLMRLLQGINRDYEGFLKIDGNDLRDINLRHLRQSFGVVLQDNFLFRGTIRDNIIAGRPGLTMEDAVRAARLAGAEEFIERMPNGYDTIVEEGSPNLSGGQKQRLAIARALITDPRILILDEATSALDPESEALVNANLLRIARGRTMVIVSHRLSSLTECDQIMMLDQGRLIDIAPHRVLLERCAMYRQLWAQQNRHVDAQGPRHARLAMAQGE